MLMEVTIVDLTSEELGYVLSRLNSDDDLSRFGFTVTRSTLKPRKRTPLLHKITFEEVDADEMAGLADSLSDLEDDMLQDDDLLC